MDPDSSFEHLMARLRCGDDEAAAMVFRRFACQLIALARQHLDTRMRAKVDPEDIVQSVFRSFFVRCQDNAWQFPNWDSLWGLLTLVTLRKCSNRCHYLCRECRDARREVDARATISPDAPSEPIDPAPSPVEAVMLTETVQHLLEGLAPPERAVVELTLQGYSAAEIAEQLGRATRSVRRVREQVRKWLQSWTGSPLCCEGEP
jgi:RNA polymerase sigma-70 factor (ECF subfamily)